MPAVGMLPSATSTSSREDLTGDGGVCKEIVRKAPDGALIPPHGSRVWVHYVGRLEDGTVFDSSRGRDQPLEFKLGVGQLISAYDIGVKTMRQGELALITCRSDHGYGWAGSPPKVPSDATLSFEVELIGWVEKTLEDMYDGEKLEHAQGARDQGAVHFKEQEWAEASAKFRVGIEHLDALGEGAAKASEARAALLSCLLNLAQCCLKLGGWGGLLKAPSWERRSSPPLLLGLTQLTSRPTLRPRHSLASFHTRLGGRGLGVHQSAGAAARECQGAVPARRGALRAAAVRRGEGRLAAGVQARAELARHPRAVRQDQGGARRGQGRRQGGFRRGPQLSG